MQIILKQRKLSRSGRSSDKRPMYVLESYVMIARVTSLFAVLSENSNCKVIKEPNELLLKRVGRMLERFKECQRHILFCITIAIYNGNCLHFLT